MGFHVETSKSQGKTDRYPQFLQAPRVGHSTYHVDQGVHPQVGSDRTRRGNKRIGRK